MSSGVFGVIYTSRPFPMLSVGYVMLGHSRPITIVALMPPPAIVAPVLGKRVQREDGIALLAQSGCVIVFHSITLPNYT